VSRILQTTNARQAAQAALRRRISDAATRRFVASAQRALPRDGTATRQNARSLVAKLARQARKPRNALSSYPPSAAKSKSARLFRRRAAEPRPFRLPPNHKNNFQIMNLTLPNNRLPAEHNGRSMIPFIDQSANPPSAKPSHRSNHSHKRRALRLGHVHLKVRDLNRSIPFYIRMLGLRLTEWVGRYAFLATDNEHHSVALEEIGTWAVSPSRRAVGIAHVAFEVPDRAAFGQMRRRLSEADVPFISRNNGISWAMRFKDPDQNEIEIYVDRRHAPDGAMLWKGRWHGPLNIEPKAKSIVSAAA